MSRGLETSLAFDDVGNASDICLQHTRNLSLKFSYSWFPSQKRSDSDEVISFTESVSDECLSESRDSGETEVESWNRSTL